MPQVRIPKGTSATAVDDQDSDEEGALSFPQGAKIVDITFPSPEVWSGTYEGRTGKFWATSIRFDPTTCSRCEGLLSDQSVLAQLVSGAGISVCVTRWDFRTSLELGCNICVPLCTNSHGTLQEWVEESKARPFRFFRNEGPGDGDQKLTLNYCAEGSSEVEGAPYDIHLLKVRALVGERSLLCDLHYHVYADHEDPAAKYVSARPLKRVDDSSLDLARRWVEDCLNFHIDCPGPEVVALPTRVLDVGPEDGSHDPRLFLTRGIKGRYAALSYCWGGPQQFKLSLDTLQEKQQDISMCELPEGFQDAVEVTRGLRLRYLWIDALCIIQDSDADKAIQMATMDQVYHSAWVTICAANVRKCTRSFLSFHVPRSYHHPYELAKISFPCPNGSKGNIFIEAGNEYLANKEPLNNRGWALQERLVSPRVLTFGHHQMYWQCQSALHGEGGVTEEFWRPYLPRLGNDFFWQKKETKSPTDPHQIYGNWFDIVEDYTLRQLTVSSDKLPALSGIATRFASVLNDSYCAGLWKNDLKNGLGWQRDSYGGRRSAEYRAPTWSWASVEDDVSWSGRRRQSQLDIVMRTSVLSCSIRLDHPAAPFGAVREGTIELRGLVKDVDWDGGEELYDEDGEWIGDVTPDTREEILDRGPDGEETEPYIFYMGRERDKANSVTRRVSCIPVTDYHSLVLARQQDGQYTRLGIIYCERDPEKWGYLKEQVEELYGNATERTITIR